MLRGENDRSGREWEEFTKEVIPINGLETTQFTSQLKQWDFITYVPFSAMLCYNSTPFPSSQSSRVENEVCDKL